MTLLRAARLLRSGLFGRCLWAASCFWCRQTQWLAFNGEEKKNRVTHDGCPASGWEKCKTAHCESEWKGSRHFILTFFFQVFSSTVFWLLFCLVCVCVCVCAPELDHWLCYSILCLTAASAPRLTKWIFLFFFFLLKPRLLLWFNAWEHLCQGLNYSHAEAESKIRTETHWPFFFFFFLFQKKPEALHETPSHPATHTDTV